MHCHLCSAKKVFFSKFSYFKCFCGSISLRSSRLKRPFLVCLFRGTASLLLFSFFPVSGTRGSVLGPLRQTLAEYFGPHPLCTGRSLAPASHLQKSNPPPSTLQSWRPRSLAPGCWVHLADCLEGSFWAVVWVA